MMNSSSKVTGTLTALALLIAGCSGEAGGGATSDDGSGSGSGGGQADVTIGLSAAFSGDIAYFGQDSERGARMALDELQASGSDITYELVTADDECNPEGGASAYRQLIDVEGVDVILGSACSGSTLGGMPVLANSEVAGMTFGATNATITQDSGVGGNAYSWRMNIDDSIMGKTWTNYINEAGFEKAAILAANNDFGRGAAELYAELLPEAGVELVATEYYELSASDVRPLLTAVDQAAADVLVTFAEPTDCALFLRQMHELAMELPMYGRGGCSTHEALEALGDQVSLANGVREATYWAPTDTQADFLEAYEELHGGVPAYNTALAYYGVKTIAQAAEAGGTDPAGIQDGLAQVDWESGIGRIRFDDHNQAHPNMFIIEIRNDEPVILEEIVTDTAS